MQNVLNAVGWWIYAPWCVLLFFSGTHPGKFNPQWGTSSSCSIYRISLASFQQEQFWQDNFFTAQNTLYCQWKFQFWNWSNVSCWFMVRNGMFKSNHTLTNTGHLNNLPILGNFILNCRSFTELKSKTWSKWISHA